MQTITLIPGDGIGPEIADREAWAKFISIYIISILIFMSSEKLSVFRLSVLFRRSFFIS